MDLSQALLCLVSFTSPVDSHDSKAQLPCASFEASQEMQPKFDLNFHLLQVEKDGGSTVLAAGMGFLSTPSRE